MRLLLVFLIATSLSLCDSYKILVYNPKIGHSHSNYMGTLADILVDAGHNVTSFIPVMIDLIKDGTTKSHVIRVGQNEETKEMAKFMADGSVNFFETKMFNPIATVFISHMMGKMFAALCRNVLDQEELITKLRAENYDVMITENFDVCGLGLSHVIKPKALITGSSSIFFPWQTEESGVPEIWSTNPALCISHLDVHSFTSRAWNYVGHILSRHFFSGIRSRIHATFVEKFGHDFPSWMELNSRAAYTFVASEPLIDFAEPTMHKVFNIPGLGAPEPKPLDKEWLEVLSRRKRTVLVSFGSVVFSYMLNIDAKRSLLKTFANFPDTTFIWKYEKDDDFALNEASKVTNLVLSKWTPQNDLLNHEKLVAFVSHGGTGSVQEAARRGVPAINVPLFGDHPRNAGQMERIGLAKVYDKFQLHDSEKLTAAIKEILEDERYTQRAKHVSRMLANKPFSSQEILMKYVAFAAEFGPSPALRPQSYDMNTIEYYNLDILVAFILISFVVVVSLVKFACFLVRMCFAKKTKVE